MRIKIECDIPDRWVDDFCSMLKTMEDYGRVGHSEWIAIFSDGDGDFRPKFNIDAEFKRKKPHLDNFIECDKITLYDAG